MLTIFLINITVLTLAVLIHYEFLYRITTVIPKMKIKHRFRIVFGVFGALIAHIIEIILFAATYYLLALNQKWGYLTGNFNDSISDYIYFSFTTFTTLGVGDIEPHGQLRQLVGLESLTGLLLITWTASFLYFEMQRYWSNK